MKNTNIEKKILSLIPFKLKEEFKKEGKKFSKFLLNS